MRDTKFLKIKVGIAVVIGVVVFILAYSWIAQLKFHKKRYHYRIKFHEVGWVNKGDIVTVLGVPKGRVKGLELYPDSVIVKIWIEDYPLREGATAWIESSGFIGQMRLGVSLGHGPPLPENSTIEGTTKKTVGELIADLGEFIARSDSFLAVAIEVLSKTSENLGEATGEVTKQFHALMQNLNDAIGHLEESAGGTKSSLDSTIAIIRSTSEKIDSLLTLLHAGKGTAGKLITDESLYNEMDSTVRSLKALVEDIRNHPERYINVKLKLF